MSKEHEYEADTVIVDVPHHAPTRPRTLTRTTIQIPRESMRQVIARGTPARGVVADDEIRIEVEPPEAITREFERADLEALVARTRRPDHDARLAMTVSDGGVITSLGIARSVVTGALAEAGLARLSFMHMGKGSEIYGAQPGSPRALIVVPAGDRVTTLLVRGGPQWIPYTVRSARDVTLLVREVRKCHA